MTRYREQNNIINPAVPTVFLYDAVGGQSFTSSGEYHTWDNIKVLTSGFNYTVDDDRITLLTNTSGLFIVEFECSFFTVDNDDDLYLTSDIYRNGVVLSGSRCITAITGGSSQAIKVRNSQSIHYIVYLKRNDYLQVKTTASANTGISSAHTSRLMINFLPMKGWNNDQAGRTSFNGGVMR
jgi:hypothetical protein